MKILIVEDDKTQIQLYKDVIEKYSKTNSISIEHLFCENYNDGVIALQTPSFDAAIIDLKLSKGEELEGKKLIQAVYKKIRIPIMVYSGSISQIDDIPESALLKKYLRTEKLDKVIDEIKKVYETGITGFLKPNGIIDQKLNDIFWNNLSNDIHIWIKHKNEQTLLRYILSHFQEYLDINPDGDFEEYHANEVYLKPPIKKNIHTGDIIKIENELYIVLTPACDIVYNYKTDENGNKTPYRKADYIVLSKMKEFDVRLMCTDKKGNIDKGKIKQYVENTMYRYHYLPPSINTSGFLIDFQDLYSKPFNEYNRIATVSSPFIKDIISRFGSYYSRQGQPTFMQSTIVDTLYNNAKNN